jgi:hypothetical protein
MFISKRRPVVTPQSEHLKLVGTLAMVWGNAEFDIPPIERASMIAGMGLHDRGYGYLDNHPIGGMDDSEWFEIARRGFYMECSDMVADTIVKYHIRRLASHDNSPGERRCSPNFQTPLTSNSSNIISPKDSSIEWTASQICATACPSVFVSMCPLRAKSRFIRVTVKTGKWLSNTRWKTAWSAPVPGRFRWIVMRATSLPTNRTAIQSSSIRSFCLIR